MTSGRTAISVLLVSRNEIANQSQLAELGVHMTLRSHPVGGWLEAYRTKFDCVVVDWDAEHEAIRFVRSLRDLGPLPIVAMTAAASTGSVGVDERIKLLDAGVDDCIPRPVGHRELATRIEALVRRYRGSFL